MQPSAQELAMLAFDALPQAILIVGQGRIIMRNATASLMLAEGEHLEAVLAGQAGSLLHWPRLWADLADSCGHLEHKGLSVQGRAGRPLLVDISVHQLDKGGQTILLSVTDASDRLSMERRLLASQRLSAIGEVAAKVAHDLNNPLDGVCRYIGLAQRTGGDEAQRHLDSARSGLQRMAAIIQELLERGDRRKTSSRAPLGELVAEAIHVMQPAIDARGVRVVRENGRDNGEKELFDTQTVETGESGATPKRRCRSLGGVDPIMQTPPRVLGGGTQIGKVEPQADTRLIEVFCNIIRNALDAMDSGGTLSIASHQEDDQVVISFTDTGCGIAAEDLPRVFEPFYTTKPLGKGSGLGLAICRQVVSQSGGTISVASEGAGRGTTIALRLPLAAPGIR